MRTTNADASETPSKIGAPTIKIVGVGGAGGNSLDRINRVGMRDIETIVFNTDEQALDEIEAGKKVLFGKTYTKGFGCGGDPEMGRKCAELDRELLSEELKGADIVYLTVGLGGGTGTGAAPIIAGLARKHGAMVICIASTPFKFERGRLERARKSVVLLEKICHSLILIDNNRLLNVVPDAPLEQGFCVMDQLITNVVHGITEAITKPSMINLDYADFQTILKEGGTSTILYGENDARNPELVVSDVLGNPLINTDLTGASGALVHITGGEHMSLQRIDRIMQGITGKFSEDANIIMGTRVDSNYSETIRVMAIITGVKPSSLELDSKDLVQRTKKKMKARIKVPSSS